MKFQEFADEVKKLLPYSSTVTCYVSLESDGTKYISYEAKGKHEREGPLMYGDLDGPTPEAALARLELRIKEAKAKAPDTSAADAADDAINE